MIAVVALLGLTSALVLAIAARNEPGPTTPPGGPHLLLPLFTYEALQTTTAPTAPSTRALPCPVASRGCATTPCIQFVAAPVPLRRQGDCNAFPRARPHFYRIARTGR
jgi:hypothetical protein